jgi:hypothetical protein
MRRAKKAIFRYFHAHRRHGFFILKGENDEKDFDDVTPVEPTPTPVEPTPTANNTITLLVIDINDEIVYESIITVDQEVALSALELIEAHTEIIYTEFEGLGIFVYGVAGFFPTEYNVSFNYYLSLYIDGTESEVGIDQITPEDGMTITFKESSMLDAIDLEVDRVIYHFLDELFDVYINTGYIHHDVLAAVSKLYTMGYDVPEFLTWITPELPTYLDTINTTTAGQLFKKIMIETIFGESIEDTLGLIENLEVNNHYDAITLLHALYVGKSQSDHIQSLKDSLYASDPAFIDPDYAGMLLLALSPYVNEEGVLDVIEDKIDYIKNQQTKDGIESWGNVNAASTAVVVLGLIAQGINPRDEGFTVLDVDLIEALLSYHTPEGFKWLLTSDDPDLLFSTPQAFAALVAYKLYRDVWGNPPVYLYDVIDIQAEN